MNRTATRFFPPLGRLRVPTLAFLAGVGFFISGGSATGAEASSRTAEPPGPTHAVLDVGYPGPVTALHPSPRLATPGTLGDTLLVKRLPNGRCPGPADAGAPRHREPGGSATHVTRLAGGPGSEAARAAAAYSAATLLRIGRLSAPSTAPPASPF